MPQDPGITWFNTQFYPDRRTCRAVRYEDGIIPRLREPHVGLFTPWGPRYSWEQRGTEILEHDKEVAVLEHLAGILREWKSIFLGKQFTWLFLGADLYGTRINHLPPAVVSEYFRSLEGWIARIIPEARLELWSDYDQIAAPLRQIITVAPGGYFSQSVITRAQRTAQAMQRGGDPLAYLAERLVEAAIIGMRFPRPIKISCVGRHKDDGVDGDLPRLYLVPEDLHAPWM